MHKLSYDEKKRMPGESMDAWLSRLGALYEEWEAKERGLTVAQLRTVRRECEHDWQPAKDGNALIDECVKCGEGRA